LLQARDTRTFRFPDVVFHYFDLKEVYRGNYSKTKFLYLERPHVDNMVTRMGLRPLIADKPWLQEWLNYIFQIPFDKEQPHKERVAMLEEMYRGLLNVYVAAHIHPDVHTIIHLPAGHSELFNAQYAMFNEKTAKQLPLPRRKYVLTAVQLRQQKRTASGTQIQQ
jgi:hypothetical protein